MPPWAGIYGGVPPFDKFQVGTSSRCGCASGGEIAESMPIAVQSADGDFENHARRHGARRRAYVTRQHVFQSWQSTRSSPEFPKVEQKTGAEIHAFQDASRRTAAVCAYRSGDQGPHKTPPLTPEQTTANLETME